MGIETDGRRKKIADKLIALAEKSELFCVLGYHLINKKSTRLCA